MMTLKKILVVDDDPIFKLIAKKLFERSHNFFKVDFLENGLQAIEFLKESAARNYHSLPDIILLDIEMPVMNGWAFMDEFLKLPKELRSNISIYTVSSSIAQEDKNKTIAYPEIKAYITKPLTAETISNFALS